MTELTMSLLGAGSCVIVAVVAYNFWQEYKARKKVERAFGNGQDDVLMRNDTHAAGETLQRHEPSLHAGTPGAGNPAAAAHSGSGTAHASQQQRAQTPSAANPEDAESGSGHADHDGGAPHQGVQPQTEHAGQDKALAPKSAPVAGPLPIDEFIDCVIPLEFEHPVRGEKILTEIQSLRRVGNKPVHFVGEHHPGVREVITHAGIYTQLYAGVQLVSRSGALNELEYSELLMKLRQIADNLNAHPDLPDMQHVMDAGRDLHHDAQLSVNVHTNDSPWEIQTLLAALTKHGFSSRPDGRMAMMDGEGGPLFTLSTNSNAAEQVTRRITLLLDVPCVAAERHGFNAMVACAKSLALRLGGTVVDDGNQILDDATLSDIEGQVGMFYAAMQAADIPAGSTRALRLFS